MILDRNHGLVVGSFPEQENQITTEQDDTNSWLAGKILAHPIKSRIYPSLP